MLRVESSVQPKVMIVKTSICFLGSCNFFFFTFFLITKKDYNINFYSFFCPISGLKSV